MFTFPADRPKPADETFWEKGVKSGPFVYYDKMIYDQRQNLLWAIETLKEQGGPITDTDDSGVSFTDVKEWCNELNAFQYGDQIQWRIPTLQEFVRTYVPKTRTYTLEELPVPRHPNLKPDTKYFTSDFKKSLGLPLFQQSRGAVLNFRRPEYVPEKQPVEGADAMAVCPGPFDIFNALKGINPSPPPPSLQAVIDDAIEAFRKRDNYMKLQYHIKTKAQALYHAQLWRTLLEDQLPLRFGIEILAQVRYQQDYMPGFWFEYGHLAMLCGNTEIAVSSARKARAILLKESYWKEHKHARHLVAMTAVLEALALSEAAYQEETVASAREQAEMLLQEFGPFTGNPYLLPYLYDFGTRLFEDSTLLAALEEQLGRKPTLPEIGSNVVVPTRQKLAAFFDLDESILPGVEFFRFAPKEQEFLPIEAIPELPDNL